MEEDGSRVQGYPLLHSMFEASLGYMTFCDQSAGSIFSTEISSSQKTSLWKVDTYLASTSKYVLTSTYTLWYSWSSFEYAQIQTHMHTHTPRIHHKHTTDSMKRHTDLQASKYTSRRQSSMNPDRPQKNHPNPDDSSTLGFQPLVLCNRNFPLITLS